jgi:HEAT repeat protein
MHRHAAILLVLAAVVPLRGQTPTHPTLKTFVGPRLPRVSAEGELLRRAGVGTEPAALLELLRTHSRSDIDVGHLDELMRRLGDDDYDRREKAARELISLGRPALARLRKACDDDDDAEVRRLAAHCAKEIEKSLNKDAAFAAVRLLIAQPVPGTAEVLLAYLPDADAETAEAIFFGLQTVGVHDGRVDAVLRSALSDAAPQRRAAAALVLGRRGNDADRAAVRQCLTDREAEVRLRAAQGLLAGRDPSALPALIALLDARSVEGAWQAEELLRWTAGRAAPDVSGDLADDKAVRKRQDAWTNWLKENPTPNWDAVFHDYRRPGLFIVAATDLVMLVGCDGKARHSIRVPDAPLDAQLLPGPKLLTVEQTGDGNRVRLRNLRGQEIWMHRTPGTEDYMACQLLANGHIFLAGDEGFGELSAGGEELLFVEHAEDMPLLDAVRFRSGRIFSANGPQLIEHNVVTGRPLRGVVLPNGRRGTSQTRLHTMPGGDLVVTLLNGNKVMQLGPDLEPVWEVPVQRPSSAEPLPNGNLLVSTQHRENRIIELTRDGATVWETSAHGRIARVRSCLNLVRVGFDHPRPKDFDLDGVPHRIEMLTRGDLAERKRSADALADLGSAATAAIAALIGTLDHEDVDLQQRAGHALMRIGAEAVPALVRGMKQGTPRVRGAAARTLGQMSTTARNAMPDLIAVLADEKQEVAVRRAAANALGNFHVDGAPAVPELLAALRAEDFQLRASAAEALGLIHAEPARVVPALVAALKDPTDAVKLEASGALTNFGPNAKEAVRPLLDLLNRPTSAQVRREVIGAIGAVGRESKEAVGPLAEILKDSAQREDLRAVALTSLTQMKPVVKEAFPAILGVFKDDLTSSELHRTIAAHLAADLPEESPPLLAQGLKEGTKSAKMAIMGTVVNWGGRGKVESSAIPKEIHAAIKEIADKESDPAVKAQAERALQRLDGRMMTR